MNLGQKSIRAYKSGKNKLRSNKSTCEMKCTIIFGSGQLLMDQAKEGSTIPPPI